MFADNSVDSEDMPRSRKRNTSADGGIVNRVSSKVDRGGE